MRKALAMVVCAALAPFAVSAYAADDAATPQLAVSNLTAPRTTPSPARLSADEQVQLTALEAQAPTLGLQAAGRECTSSGDTDCTRTTDCSSQVLTFGIVGVLFGSFGGAAGAVGGGALGAGVGYGICASGR